MAKKRSRKQRVFPGFGLSLGYSLLYLSLILFLPLSALAISAVDQTWVQFWSVVTSPQVVMSYRISIVTALAAAGINMIFGSLIAWVLVRYRFPGRRLLDGMIDLPFALPTAVAGITLATLYAETGWVGGYLAQFGLKVAFTPLGIIVALIFVTLPFVVRTVQPVLQALEPELEEAAVTLGATRLQIFRRVIFPELLPAQLTGFALALARALGEYGSVVFISGNMPMKTEVAPLLIMTRLDQFDYVGATAIAIVMLLASFALLLPINYLQWQSNRHVTM
ncbi:MAG: Sulfate transport system permease protein CysT [Firmicutes bacterium]|nr:Sulfate transport system permease protein CysT [Bacillota bacterium]